MCLFKLISKHTKYKRELEEEEKVKVKEKWKEENSWSCTCSSMVAATIDWFQLMLFITENKYYSNGHFGEPTVKT